MNKKIIFLKVILHLAAFMPLIWLFYAVNANALSADPAKDIQHFTGGMGLKLLLITLSISPISRFFGVFWLLRVRRLLGLWCFFWASLHLVSYLLLELGIDNLSLFFSEVTDRFYLNLGLISWFILLILTLTSPKWMMRKLGKNWQKIHFFIYPTVILVLIHYIISVKTLSFEPIVYAVLGVTLLLFRWKKFYKHR